MAPMKCPARHKLSDSFTLTHLARRWHMHRRQIRHLLQTGQLPFEQVRGQFRVPRAAVAEFERTQQRS
jgi:excisionase family DNA binding protein